MTFEDRFSDRAALYATCRPDYPDALLAHLASIPSETQVAFDCATGNGQAAAGLKRHFNRVVAGDASQRQLAHATRRSAIGYVAATAEQIPLRGASVDLVTVAQALHWLDLDRFYDEVRRILAPGGAIAAWGYGDPVLDDPELNEIVHGYNRGTIENYWAPERMILLEGYSTIPFPFEEVVHPAFTLERDWTLDELAGYLRTWSATASYTARHGVDPVIALENVLAKFWGPPEARQTLRWPLFLRVGCA